jgi:aspartate aminotransferase
MISLSRRVSVISSSPTVRLIQIKKQLQSQGKQILDFGAGEPDFPTPEHIKQAGVTAIRSDFTKYTPTPGIMELKKAIISTYGSEQGHQPAENEIIVTAGSKYGLFLLLAAIIDGGDEVIIPRPYWVSYPEMVIYFGGTVTYADHLTTSPLFEMTADSFISRYTPKTKAVIINSPSNPTGKIMAAEELIKAIDFFTARNVLVIVDDCYRKIMYTDSPYPSPLQLRPQQKDLIAVVCSLSKTYSMTGWRIGYVLASQTLVAAMTKIAEHSTSNPCSISQKAAVEALLGDQQPVHTMVSEYRKRCDFFRRRCDEIGHIPYRVPDGAFYFFADFSHYIQAKHFKSDQEFAMDILEKLNIILVPGSAFGAPGYARLSFATALPEIEEGLRRLESYLKN